MALKDAKDDILKKYSTTLSEQIADEIRLWFKEYHHRMGKFPEFPTEDNGGSRQLLSRQGGLHAHHEITILCKLKLCDSRHLINFIHFHRPQTAK